MLEIVEEVEVSIRVIEDGQVDEALAIVAAEQIIGIFIARNACLGSAGHDAFLGSRLVIEVRVHLELHVPAAAHDHDQADYVLVDLGKVVLLGKEPGLEFRIEQLCLLLFPRKLGDLLPAWLEAEGVDGALPRHDDAVSAQRDLGDDVRAIVVLRAHRGDLLVERHFLGDGLQRGESNGKAGFAAQLAHPAELVPFAHHVAGHFEHAVTGAAHGAPDLDQFFCGGRGAGDDLPVDIAVKHGARGRETERAGADAFFDDGRHLRDVILGRDSARTLPVTEHVGANRTVRHMGAHVDRTRQFFERIEIFGEGLPVPAHAFGQRGAGDVLDPFHQADQPFVLVGLGRSEADAAIAHDDRGDTVPAGRGHFLVPGRLPVVMRVDVHEAGGHQQACRIDLFRRVAGHSADLRNKPVLDGDVAGETRCAGPVDDGAATDDRIECGHVVILSLGREGSTLQPICLARFRGSVRAFARRAKSRAR